MWPRLTNIRSSNPGPKITRGRWRREWTRSIKSKAEIVKFLNESFAYFHKAVAGINEGNLLSPVKNPFGDDMVTRLALATLNVGHCFDHYGQMVEYLRMNSIIPPASRQ